VTAQTRAEGGTFVFAYTNLETVITNPEGGVQKHLHDANGNLIELTEENQKIIRSQFDSAGRRISEATRSGEEYSWTYHAASGELLSATSPGNLTVSFDRAERDFRGFKVYETSRITYSDGTTEQFEIDSQGNIASFIDRAGRKSTYSYNPQGRMLAMTNPAGGTITCEYNADGTRRLLHRQVPGGPIRTTSFFYDNARRLSRIEYADGNRVEYAYNNLDLLETVKDEDSGLTSYEYSPNGLLEKITLPLGNTIRMSYDRMNELVKVTDHAGHSIVRNLDQMGRLQSITDRNGNRQSFVYDSLGHLTNYVDAAGNAWSRTLDIEGRVVSETDPLGQTRQYQYDNAGRVRGISNPPEELRLTHDELGRPLTLEFPPGRTNFLAYRADGMLSGVSLAGLVSSEYIPDPLGSVGAINDANGKQWRMVNDAFGRPREFIDPLLRTNEFILDERERISRLIFPGQLGSVSNIFNGRGRITRKAFSDGTALDFAFDANGRIISGTGLTLSYNEQDDIVGCNGLALGRDPGGRLTSVTLAPGKTIQYAYDSRNLVTNITDWLGGSTSFQYDAASRLLSITRPNGVKTSYAYDAASRLTGIKDESAQILASIELERDPAGLILSAKKSLPLDPVLTNGAHSLAYDAAAQIVGAEYDSLGRMTGDGPRRFEWDLASRLTNCSTSAANLDLTYDAFGELLAHAQNGVRREYVWNLALPLRSPAVIRESGRDSEYLVHTPRGELLYSIDASSGERSFYHFDESGNTLFLTDNSGTITGSYAYTPYGVLAARQGVSRTPFTFGGRYSLISFPDLELVSVRQRWLDTRNGRFLSRDPNWGLSINPNELNPYAYARSNPLYYADPFGLDATVNQNGVHTDISVDIWQGDQIAGTLTVSYAAKGYTGKFGGVVDAFSTVIGGTQGEFSIDFKPGSARDTANPDAVSRGTQIIIEGTREQDERLRLALAGIIGADGDWEFVGRGQSIIRNFIYQSSKGKKQHLVIDATIDDWETYRAASQSCNDFTDAMLDIYFGENWYLGPIFEGDGLTSELKDYLKPKSTSPVLDPNGIARITGTTVVR
jgi:RHS repeat-associated protein